MLDFTLAVDEIAFNIVVVLSFTLVLLELIRLSLFEGLLDQGKSPA